MNEEFNIQDAINQLRKYTPQKIAEDIIGVQDMSEAYKAMADLWATGQRFHHSRIWKDWCDRYREKVKDGASDS